MPLSTLRHRSPRADLPARPDKATLEVDEVRPEHNKEPPSNKEASEVTRCQESTSELFTSLVHLATFEVHRPVDQEPTRLWKDAVEARAIRRVEPVQRGRTSSIDR